MSTPAVIPQATHEAIDNLQVRLYKVTTRSHLRIGAGEGSTSLAATDNPVIQALFYTPPANGNQAHEERVIYLPGSSLHGVIRAWAEKIHRSRTHFFTSTQLIALLRLMDTVSELKQSGKFEQMGEQELLKKLNYTQVLQQLEDLPSDESRFAETMQLGSAREWLGEMRSEVGDYLGRKLKDNVEDMSLLFQHLRIHSLVCDPLSLLDQCQRFGQAAEGQVLPAKQTWFDLLRLIHKRANPCPVCQVFGYVGQRGRVRIQHAYPAQGGTPLDVITRVAINRISGAADEGKLFDMEAVPPGAVFYFYVVLENLNPEQRRTFDAGIQALQLQLATLGAHSTVGFGVVEMERVVQAVVRPALFERTDLPGQVQEVGRTHQLCPGAATLAAGYYPSFYRALTMTDRAGQPPALFNGLVDITYGEH